MMPVKVKMREGFEGQRAIIIPRSILQLQCAAHPLIGTLYITDIGYYPNARYHYRKRPAGAEECILIFCAEGKGHASIAGKSYAISSGECIIIPSGHTHMYASADDTAWTIYWLHFSGEKARSMADTFITQFQGNRGTVKDPGTSVRLFDEMYCQLERGYYADNLLYCNMLLWHYFASFLQTGLQPHETVLETRDTVGKSIDFLKNNIHRPLSLAEIAGHINLSVAHFSELFKRKSGFSPIDYFNQLKIQQACRYLLFTDLRIKEIAALLGIADMYYFSRLFSRIMGVAPSEYRKEK